MAIRIRQLPWVLLFLLLLVPPHAFSRSRDAHLRFSPTDADNPGRFSLMIDRAEKLAGMKVTLSYDNNLLRFIKAEKAAAVASFMYTVNDTHPGTVIIVMASAEGISGVDMELLLLEFASRTELPEPTRKVSVTQIQLMDEHLQEISTDTPEYYF